MLLVHGLGAGEIGRVCSLAGGMAALAGPTSSAALAECDLGTCQARQPVALHLPWPHLAGPGSRSLPPCCQGLELLAVDPRTHRALLRPPIAVLGPLGAPQQEGRPAHPSTLMLRAPSQAMGLQALGWVRRLLSSTRAALVRGDAAGPPACLRPSILPACRSGATLSSVRVGWR